MKETQIPLEPQASTVFVTRAEDVGSAILPPGEHARRFRYLSVSNSSPDALVAEINRNSMQGWEVSQILLNGATFVAFLKRPH